MAGTTGRARLRGAEGLIFDLVWKAFTPEQWASWLEAPLELASSQGDVNLARKLVRAGGEIGISLHEAVRGGHVAVVSALLDNGASASNKDGNGDSPLHIAAEVGQSEIARSLLVHGADKNTLDIRGRAPLHLAAEFDRLAVAQVLLNADADLNVRFDEDEDEDDQIHSSPLDMAAGLGHLGVLKAMIEHGGETAVKSSDYRGHTALHHAGRSGDVGAIDMLVEAGAEVNAASTYGSTPLHFSATWSNVDATRALLRHGAPVNSQTIRGETALHWVSEFAGTPGSSGTVAVLLRGGANETLRDCDGHRAEDMVARKEDEWDRVEAEIESVKLLLRKAPSERAWRRRGFLALCRAFPDRVQLAPRSVDTAVAHPRKTKPAAPRTRSRVKRAALEEAKDVGGDDEDGEGWSSVAGWVLGLEEEGLFRTIVGYL